MTNSEARKRRAEALAVQHEPLDEWFRRIGTTLSNEDYETGISAIARLTAERDAALVQVAAVAALADEWEAAPDDEDGPDCDESMACSICVKAEQGQRIRRLLTDPATVLARRDAEKWDEGYSKGNLDGYFGTNNEKNPYRIEKEQG